jgi:hypothetical protein
MMNSVLNIIKLTENTKLNNARPGAFRSYTIPPFVVTSERLYFGKLLADTLRGPHEKVV